MKQNFTVRQGALDGVEAFLNVARHRSFRKAAAELGVTPSAISQAVHCAHSSSRSNTGASMPRATQRPLGNHANLNRPHSSLSGSEELQVAKIDQQLSTEKPSGSSSL